MRRSLGSWPDQWNPEDLLRGNHLACLLPMDTVRAVGADPNPSAGPDDLIINADSSIAERGARGREEHNFSIAHGQVHLATLLGDLQTVFATTGNTHWGDATDARLLSDALDVGFLMFADELQNRRRCCLYSLNQLRGDFPFFVNLWWQEPVHFRAADFRSVADTDFLRCFARPEVPAFLQAQYNEANRSAPFGSAQQAM